jgi:prepilin peptidase CpaA
MPLPPWSTGVVVLLVFSATVTDLRWRRIPNLVTLPAIGAGLVIHIVAAGWEGLLLWAGGTLLAPCVLILIHGGKVPGAGDVKLAAALGAILGPILGGVAMLFSGVAGGVLAGLWILAGWDSRRLGPVRVLFGRGSRKTQDPKGTGSEGSLETLAIPYGVAISIGALVTLGMLWWTGEPERLAWLWTVVATPSSSSR